MSTKTILCMLIFHMQEWTDSKQHNSLFNTISKFRLNNEISLDTKLIKVVKIHSVNNSFTYISVFFYRFCFEYRLLMLKNESFV